MAVEIGRRYYEERQKLIDIVNSGNAEVVKTRAERNRCYLCMSRIAPGSEMRVVLVKGSVGRESIGYRFLHDGCYKSILGRKM